MIETILGVLVAVIAAFFLVSLGPRKNAAITATNTPGKVEGERNAVMLQRNHNEEIKRLQANHSFIVTHLTKELTEAVADD